MSKLVDAIADLIGLRDRQALDHALVTLIRDYLVPTPISVAIYRQVGDVGDERWLTCAHLKAGQPSQFAKVEWIDPSQLPLLASQPLRQQAMDSRQLVQVAPAQGGPCLALFPVAEQHDTLGVLEIESTQPLPQASCDTVSSLLRVYRNFRGLLDYGERDTLTDLLNRKTFEGSFMKALMEKESNPVEEDNRRVSKDTGSTWFAMIDIDHFKRVNDNFGHLIGDEVLLLLARLMRTNFRFHDEIYRFGGEEFVVLLKHVNAVDSHNVFERLRVLCEKHAFPQVGSITVSIGYSALRTGDTPDVAFARADKAVYYAKENGRNQVCNYEALLAQGKLVEVDANIGDVELF